MVQTNK